MDSDTDADSDSDPDPQQYQDPDIDPDPDPDSEVPYRSVRVVCWDIYFLRMLGCLIVGCNGEKE